MGGGKPWIFIDMAQDKLIFYVYSRDPSKYINIYMKK